MFQKCLQQCAIPSEWATHIIIPVFKSGEKNLVSNYRPISLLCNVSKVLEKLVYDKTINFITESISLVQFGVPKGRSTLQQLLVFLNFVHNNHDQQVDIIYLDIKKAFDSIPHDKLLHKLYSCGIQGNLWKWFKSYLSGRTQHIRIKQSLSAPLPVLSGVPQGSILGPLLFIIYMNDLPSCVTVSKTLLFVNDTKIYNTVHNSEDISAFQNDLDSASLWSKRNDMCFNPQKSVHLSINSKVTTNCKIADTQVVTNSSHKDLGITISSNLS